MRSFYQKSLIMGNRYIRNGCVLSAQCAESIDFFILALLIIDFSLYALNIFLCSACWRSSRTWTYFNGFWDKFQASTPEFYRITPKCFLNHSNSFHEELSKFRAKLYVWKRRSHNIKACSVASHCWLHIRNRVSSARQVRLYPCTTFKLVACVGRQ